MNEIFSIKIKKDVLEPLIKIHSMLANELKLIIQKDKISIKSVDPAHCELLDTVIKDRACEEYHVKEDLELGIDTDRILGFLRLAKKNDLLRFSYDPDSNRLIIKWGNLTRTMGLIDTAGMPDPETPAVDFGSNANVLTDLFHKALKSINADTYMHETQLLISEHGMGLENYTEDDDNKIEISSYIIDRSDIELLEYNSKPVIFDKEILQKMVYIFKRINDIVCIETNGYDSPLKVSIDNDISTINYWLAPRIPEDYKPEGQDQDHKEDIEEISEKISEEIPEEIKEEIKSEPEIPEEAIKEMVKSTEFDKIEPEPGIKEEPEITETEPDIEEENIKAIPDIEIIKDGEFDMEKWENIITLPCVAFVTGRRGAGKSVLGYKLQEKLSKKYNLTPVIFGFPKEKKHLLPDNIVLIDDINDLPENSFILIVEAAFKFYARQHNLSEHRLMDHVISLSRQKKQILLFDFHYTRKIDVNIVTDSDVWLAKEPGIFHVKLGARAEIKPLYKKIGDEFSQLTGNKQEYTWVYSNNYEGFMKNNLPSFWSEDLSNVHADVPLYELEPSKQQIKTVITKTNGIDTPKIILKEESKVLNEEEITELARYFRYKELVVFAERFSIKKSSKTVILIEMNKIGVLPKIPKRDECGSIIVEERE